MPGQAMGQIIPFPVRETSPPVATPAPEPDGAARLARALASLNGALADQRIAIAAWRSALAELKTTTEGLSAGLQRYHGKLGELGARMTAIKEDANRLEAWADRVIEQQG
jgi:hypothetical protein